MNDMNMMANTPQQNRNFLRTFLQLEVNQRIRLETTIKLYQQENKELTEAVVDLAESIRATAGTLTTQDVKTTQNMNDAINGMKDRLERLKETKKGIGKFLEDLLDKRRQALADSQSHLIALSEIEIEQGGFIALLFGLRENVQFDPNTNTLSFKPGGSAEASIGTKLSSWKDSSQLSIKKIKGGK